MEAKLLEVYTALALESLLGLSWSELWQCQVAVIQCQASCVSDLLQLFSEWALTQSVPDTAMGEGPLHEIGHLLKLRAIIYAEKKCNLHQIDVRCLESGVEGICFPK